ncbi:MAG: hypothetical protein WDM91_08445 [Rhizomicrobium sp.]
MNARLGWAPAAVLGAALFSLSAEAAVSVVGAGPAQLCYQAADTNASPADFMSYCDQALAGTLSDADRAATFVNRGVLKLAMADVDPAAADFQASLAIDAKMGEAYIDLGATQIAHKRYGEAVRNITKGLALGTKQPHLAYYDRAIAEEGLGDLRAAYDDYREAATLKPDFAPASDELKRFKLVEKPSGT